MDYNDQTPQFGNVPPENNGSNGYAIASLVLGILSIPLGCCYGVGVIFGILGIIFGILSKKNNYGKLPGMSIGGIICSAFGIVISLFMIIFMVYVFSQMGSSNYSDFLQYLQDSQYSTY